MALRRRAARIRVGLSSASVFPQPLERAFEIAADLGYDGLELMVWSDRVSQQPKRVRDLKHKYGVDVLSVHAPCLLLTQRVWGTEPWAKVRRSAEAAALLGARAVVLHPPFVWQRRYARDFAAGVGKIMAETGVAIAVENMFPLHISGRVVSTFAPSWDVVEQGHDYYTLDLSHTSVSGSDALQMAKDMGPNLRHVHIADGTGKASDEHLIPGRGDQPCAEVLRYLASNRFSGSVVVEANTRTAVDEDARVADIAEALSFTREHLGQNPPNVPK